MRRLVLPLLVAGLVLATSPSRAQSGRAGEPVPDLEARAPAAADLTGRPVVAIRVELRGDRWRDQVPRLALARVGDLMSPALARRAVRELMDSGRFAEVAVEARRRGKGVELVLSVLPRRVADSIRITGAKLGVDPTIRAAGLRDGQELTARSLEAAGQAVRRYYASHGYPKASVDVSVLDTDDPLKVVVELRVTAGRPLRVGHVEYVLPRRTRGTPVAKRLGAYDVVVGDRLDESLLDAADDAVELRLREAGHHEAEVRHTVKRQDGRARVSVVVRPGPRYRFLIHGAEHLDGAQIVHDLDLTREPSIDPERLSARVRDHFVQRGFLDARVTARVADERRGTIRRVEFRVREGRRIRVRQRRYPCFTGSLSARELDAEVNSFLVEELPGEGLFGAVNGAVVDDLHGPQGATGPRPSELRLDPTAVYYRSAYLKAMQHLESLFRDRGYLSVRVGPMVVQRRRCDLNSAPGHCRPLPLAREPARCSKEAPGDGESSSRIIDTCVPDPKRGVYCEATVGVAVPIRLGPRTQLYDLAFDGNEVFVEKELAKVVDLPLGKPLARSAVDKARLALLDHYAEEGFAYATVDTDIDLSPDGTRARVRFVISERDRVIVEGSQVGICPFKIHGARFTRERVICGRVALEVGKPYRRSLVRETERRLATLGVFTNVVVNLEEPQVPAASKRVVITVQERKPQSFEPRIGFSTGEGFRGGLQYQHINLGGRALRGTIGVFLSYLPDELILDTSVRGKFPTRLDLRLERRITAALEIPEIGLGPLVRLNIEGLEVRDNARDFGLTRRAGIVTLLYSPVRRLTLRTGFSVEGNSAEIFGERTTVTEYIRQNPSRVNIFTFPDGDSIALAWPNQIVFDARDNPLEATRGYYVSTSVEYVRSFPLDESRAGGSTDPFAPSDAEFLRLEGRLAGYLRLTRDGLALALSLASGTNVHVRPNSLTYPDRLFFLGGQSSLRGFQQSALVPEDLVPDLLSGDLTIADVPARGGDFYINPRVELRIPLTKLLKTAIFVDAGNVWRNPWKNRSPGVQTLDFVNPAKLRYTAGSGLRFSTPIGPLAIDYGFNLHRVVDGLAGDPAGARTWEDLGALAFSVGLF